MEKLTFAQARKIIDDHNKQHGIRSQYADSNPLDLVIVFTNDSFKKDYNLEQRSYITRSDEKYFLPEMGGSSLYGDCVAGDDSGVRLDWYLGEWKIEYCYFKGARS